MNYRVGILGAGRIASGYDKPNSEVILSHAHAVIDNGRLELRGFYDADREISRVASEKWGTSSLDSFEELASGSDIVCVAVPDKYHYKYLCRLLDYDNIKAVICEKPLALSLSDAEDIVSRYNDRGLPLIVNYSRRFMNGFHTVKELVSGYGRFLGGTCFYGKGLIHNGSHMIDLLDYLIGLDEFRVDRLFSSYVDEFDSDPSISFHLTDGSSGISFDYIPCDICTVFQADLFFEHGRLYYDDSTETVKAYSPGGSLMFPGYTNYIEDCVIAMERNSALINLYSEVADRIKSGSHVSSDGSSALRTLKKCFEVHDSLEDRTYE